VTVYPALILTPLSREDFFGCLRCSTFCQMAFLVSSRCFCAAFCFDSELSRQFLAPEVHQKDLSIIGFGLQPSAIGFEV